MAQNGPRNYALGRPDDQTLADGAITTVATLGGIATGTQTRSVLVSWALQLQMDADTTGVSFTLYRDSIANDPLATWGEDGAGVGGSATRLFSGDYVDLLGDVEGTTYLLRVACEGATDDCVVSNLALQAEVY